MIRELRQRLYNVLMHPAALNMSFIAVPIHVRGAGFFSVAAFVSSGEIGVTVDDEMLGDANCVYNRRKDEFIFPSYSYGLTDGQRSSMLHEGVHAMNDFLKTKATYFEDEVAAYIADAIYFRSVRRRSAQDIYGEDLEPHEKKADEIAGMMINLPASWFHSLISGSCRPS